MNMNSDIRRIVDASKPLPTVEEALAMADAAKLQMRELQRRLDRLESDRGSGRAAPEPAPAPAAVARGAAAPPSMEDIQRALTAMDPTERAHLLTRYALRQPGK